MALYVRVELGAQGHGTVTIGANQSPVIADDLPAARTQVMKTLATLARQRGGVRADVADPTSAYLLIFDRTGALKATKPSETLSARTPAPRPASSPEQSHDEAVTPRIDDAEAMPDVVLEEPAARAEAPAATAPADEGTNPSEEQEQAIDTEPDQGTAPVQSAPVEHATTEPEHDLVDEPVTTPDDEPDTPTVDPEEHEETSAPQPHLDDHDAPPVESEDDEEAPTPQPRGDDDVDAPPFVPLDEDTPGTPGTDPAGTMTAVDVDDAPTGVQGEPIDQVAPVTTFDSIVGTSDHTDETGDPSPHRRPGTWRVRRRTAGYLAGGVLVASAALLSSHLLSTPTPSAQDSAVTDPAATARILEQRAADQDEARWIAEQNRAASKQRVAALEQSRRAEADALLDVARTTLETNPEAGEDPRNQLAAMIETTQARIDAGNWYAQWRSTGRTDLETATQAVLDAQSAWQAEQEAQASIQTPAPQAPPAQAVPAQPQTPAPRPTPAPAPAAPAQPQPPAEVPPAQEPSWIELRADPLQTTSSEPGIARVRVTVSGNRAVTVVLTVAGQSVSIGSVDGSGTLVGEISGLPAGSHSWSVSAGETTATGSPIRVF